MREAVTSQRDARVVFIDLSEVNALEGGGLGMLIFLQRYSIRRNLSDPGWNMPARSQSLNLPLSTR